MRDNHDHLPELLSAVERDGHHIGHVAVTLGEGTRVYQFGLTPQGYRAFRRMTTLRPFDAMPGVRHRYFFVPTAGRTQRPSVGETRVRVETERRGKEFDVEAPIELIANLMWFFELKDFAAASHLVEVVEVDP